MNSPNQRKTSGPQWNPRRPPEPPPTITGNDGTFSPGSPAREQLKASLTEATGLLTLFETLQKSPGNGPDLSGVAHAALVLGVSALDRYVRTRIESDLIALCSKAPSIMTLRAKSLSLDLGVLLRGESEDSPGESIAHAIRQSLRAQTFLPSERLAEGLQYLKPGNFWTFAALGLGGTEEGLRERIDSLVERRSNATEPYDFDDKDRSKGAGSLHAQSTDALSLISRVVDCIEEYLK